MFVLLVSVSDSWCSDTRSSLSTFSADLMGVAHFLAERRLRADWPELGGVGVDCTELVLVEPAFTTSVMIATCEKRTPFKISLAISTVYISTELQGSLLRFISCISHPIVFLPSQKTCMRREYGAFLSLHSPPAMFIPAHSSMHSLNSCHVMLTSSFENTCFLVRRRE